MFYTYVIQSKKNEEIYIGYTSDLKKRVAEHNLGLNLSTKRYRPWKIIYYEACLNKKDAERRELFKKDTRQKIVKYKIKRVFKKSKDLIN